MGKQNYKILVIDDEKGVLDLFCRVLIRDGVIVETASNGQKGLEMISRETYDLIYGSRFRRLMAEKFRVQ